MARSISGGACLLSCLFLASIAFLAAGEPVQRNVRPNRLWVQLCDTTGLDPAHLVLIEREVSSIYAKADVEIVWLRRCEHFPVGAQQLNVARAFILHTIPQSLALHLRHLCIGESVVMGYVLTDVEVGPGGVVYLSRKAIESHAGGSMTLTTRLRARAIGRVLAHELAHRFLSHVEHTPKGILKPIFSETELTDFGRKCFYFSEKQVRTLHVTAKLLEARGDQTGKPASRSTIASNPQH